MMCWGGIPWRYLWNLGGYCCFYIWLCLFSWGLISSWWLLNNSLFWQSLLICNHWRLLSVVADIQHVLRSKLNIRFGVSHNKMVNQFIELHLVNLFSSCFTMCHQSCRKLLCAWLCNFSNDFSLFLIFAHGEIVYTVVELWWKETIFVHQGLMLPFSNFLLDFVLLIDDLLFSLNIFEHVFRLR